MFFINSLATYVKEVKYKCKLLATSTLKIVHIYRLYRDQSANMMSYFQGLSYLQHPFLHLKQKAGDQKK